MNKTVLVTGSSRGIGKAIAIYLARRGYDLVLHCRSRLSEAEAAAAEITALGRQARILQFDIGNRSECAEVLSADVEAHGAHYGVVCNAGISADNAFPALTGEDWDSVIRTNLDGFYNVLQPLVMPMVRLVSGSACFRFRVTPGMMSVMVLEERSSQTLAPTG